MTSLFTINCCKSFGCKNLGLASSADYSWPEYRLGYAALHCRACGSLPPLFDEEQFRCWLSAYLADFAANRGQFAHVATSEKSFAMGIIPRVASASSAETAKSVDTKAGASHQHRFARTNSDDSLARPFQGVSAGQQLYVLLSFDAIRGNVLHISSNFTPHTAGISLLYRWRGSAEPTVIHDDIIERVSQRETQFYAAASLMKSSTAAPYLNGTPAARFYARSLLPMGISAC